MASKRLGVLFVLALLAVGAFLVFELPGRRAGERERAEASRLFAFDPRAIDAIAIDRAGETLRFSLSGTHWSMVSPLTDDAEAAAVVPVISTLAQAQVLRDLGHAGDPARFGLASPPVTISLFAAGDTSAVLELGNMAVDRSAVYARRRDGRVLMLPTAIHRAVTLPVDEYRNRRVIVFDLSAVRAFEIDSRTSGHSAWQRAGGDAWFTVVAGDTVRGDSVAVLSVLRRLRGLRVRDFVPGADTTSFSPLVTVTIHKDDGSSQALRLDAVAGGGCHARVRGNSRVVFVADDPADIARESVRTLRDRRLLQFDPAQARRITAVSANTTAELVRAGDAWAFPNPALGAIDPRRTADLVRALRALRYSGPAPDATVDPRTNPRFSVVIRGAGGTILDELYCTPAPRGGELWVAWSRSVGAACEVEVGELDAIAERLGELRR